MNSIFIFSLLLLVSIVSTFQLFVPTEQLGSQSCGPFKTCPNGTVCMRLHNRLSPVSCFKPEFTDSSAFLPQSQPESTTTPKIEHNITLDQVKLIELPGCKCPIETKEPPCWTHDILSILFLLLVVAMVSCVPVFMLALSYKRRNKY